MSMYTYVSVHIVCFVVSDEEDADECPPLFFSTDEDQSDQEREQWRRPPQQMTAEELLRIR